MTAHGARRGNHVYHWKHGWIPLDHSAAISKAHHSKTGAAKAEQGSGGSIPADLVKDLRGGSADRHLVTDSTGTHFSAERSALHDRIIKQIVGGHASHEKPSFVMLGGGPESLTFPAFRGWAPLRRRESRPKTPDMGASRHGPAVPAPVPRAHRLPP